MSFQTQDADRKASVILKVLSDSREPLGARNISRRLEDYGIQLTERAVRFHLKHFDDTGLTKLVPKRAGRILTPTGHDEVRNARVRDKIGFALTKIDNLAIYPEHRLAYHPTTAVIFDRFEQLSTYTILEDGAPQSSLRDNLNDIHQEVLRMLAISEADYWP